MGNEPQGQKNPQTPTAPIPDDEQKPEYPKTITVRGIEVTVKNADEEQAWRAGSEYPKVLYGTDNEQRTVLGEEDEAAARKDSFEDRTKTAEPAVTEPEREPDGSLDDVTLDDVAEDVKTRNPAGHASKKK